MYIYEMHQHTLACSDCATLPAKELAAAIRAFLDTLPEIE